MWRWAFATAALILVGLACSSFEGDPAATPPDASVIPTDDASPSGAADGRAAPPLFCATVDASLCWSFDEIGPSGLTPFFVDGGGYTIVDDAASPPHAAYVYTADASPSALVIAPRAGLSRVTCEAKIAIEKISELTNVIAMKSANSANIYAVQATPTTNGASLNLGTLVSGYDAGDGSTAGTGFIDVVLLTEVPLGIYVTVVLDFDATGKVLRGAVDTQTAQTRESGLFQDASARPTEVRIGPESQTHKPGAYLVDDIVCRYVD